jgi:2-polyprenyl-3-methyl-5-hydroxy-6-metoxy-1,4-benzoquinol methylase
MPIGSLTAFADLVALAGKRRPGRVLDLGIGCGINGAGLRNWLDLGLRQTHITGVEGWLKYQNGIWQAYDHVEHCRIEHCPQLKRERWDFIVMTDVLEHFDKDAGRAILAKMIAALRPGGMAFVSTPGYWLAQGDWGGNALERHRSEWTPEDFPGWTITRDGSESAYGERMIVATWEKLT